MPFANELGPAEGSGDQDASECEDNEESESPEPDQPEGIIADSNDSPVADQPSPGCCRLQPFAPSHSKKVKPQGPVTITQPVPEDMFIELDFSCDTGTPVQSDVDEDFEAMAKTDDLEHQMKVTSIEKVLGGADCNNVILQVYNLKKVQRG